MPGIQSLESTPARQVVRARSLYTNESRYMTS
jgi:hypothetical protein